MVLNPGISVFIKFLMWTAHLFVQGGIYSLLLFSLI